MLYFTFVKCYRNCIHTQQSAINTHPHRLLHTWQIQFAWAKAVGEKFPNTWTWPSLCLRRIRWAPNPVGSHPKHRVYDGWAAAAYQRDPCCGTKPPSPHSQYPAQTLRFGTQESGSLSRGCGWLLFSTPSAPARHHNHQKKLVSYSSTSGWRECNL